MLLDEKARQCLTDQGWVHTHPAVPCDTSTQVRPETLSAAVLGEGVDPSPAVSCPEKSFVSCPGRLSHEV